MKIVALAGGVGGAKLADGLAQALPAQDLTIVVNTGDDFEHFGLKICPDLDTVCYTLAGIANPATGWGQIDESWNVLDMLGQLGGPTWFRLGDRDLGVHLERTRRLRSGQSLRQVTQEFCQVWGIGPSVLPMSNDPVPTFVETQEGELSFQEYFVHRQCQPIVLGFRFDNIQDALPAPGVLESIKEADAVILCPSNPWVSLDPILSIPGVRNAVKMNGKPVVAVSPLIGGQAVKGPAAKMYQEMGIQPQAIAVARHYRSLLTGFVMDEVDADQAREVQEMGIQSLTTKTLMKTREDRLKLARVVLLHIEKELAS